MKGIKIYLVIVTVLLVLAVGCGVYVWYLYQSLNKTLQPQQPDPVPNGISTVEKMEKKVATTSTQKPVVIDTNKLTPAQQAVAKTFGLSGAVTITPTMLACVKEAVGNERYDVILGGGAPTPFESLKLLPCFKK